MRILPDSVRERLSSVPVIKSGLSLMTGTMATSALGLVFWILAARLYDEANFGVATTAVYTMTMLADVACLGLRTGLVRYIPTAGAATGRTIVWGYGVVVSAATVIAVLFLLGLDWWAPELIELRTSTVVALFFLGSTAFWALFMLEDAVLVGLRKATWVPLENSLFGVLKILLLFPMAKISPTLGIFWAWTLPVFPIVVGINVLIPRVARANSGSAPKRRAATRSLVREILSFSIADWFAAVARLAALGVIPLMVLAQEGRVEAGYFQAAWLIAFTIFALSSNAAYAMLAENSYDQAKLHRNSLHAGVLSLALTVPIIAVGTLGASLLLRIYGAEYAANSATVLRILLVAAIPNVIHQIYIGRLRSLGRMSRVLLLETLLSLLVVGLAWLLIPRFGIDGVGLAWLIGLAVLAVVAIVNESVWWWAAHLDTRVVRRLGRWFRRVQVDRPARGMDSRMNFVLAGEGLVGSPVTWLNSGDDGQSAIVALNDSSQLVVDFARTEAGAEDLDRRRTRLEFLRTEPSLSELRPLLPSIHNHGTASSAEFVAWDDPVGPTALDLTRRGLSVETLASAVLQNLDPLYRVSARTITVDPATLAGWTDESTQHLLTEGRASEAKIERLRAILAEDLIGTEAKVGLIHGELALDNIIMAVDPLRVVGLRSWQFGAEMPLVLDPATLALSDLALRGPSELGQIVKELIHDPAPFEAHPAMAGLAESGLPTRGVLLLSWLHLVGRKLPPLRTASSDEFWLARNAQPVLASLSNPEMVG